MCVVVFNVVRNSVVFLQPIIIKCWCDTVMTIRSVKVKMHLHERILTEAKPKHNTGVCITTLPSLYASVIFYVT